MLYNEFQSEIVVSKEELEKLWYDPDLDTKGVIHGLRALLKERHGYEYAQELIRAIFNAEGFMFSKRREKRIFPVIVTQANIPKRKHQLTPTQRKKGEYASYDIIKSEKIN